MHTKDLFDWLTTFHFEVNLEPNLNNIKDGNMYSKKGIILEGNENHLTQGMLVLANGDSLVQKLQAEEMIEPEDLDKFKTLITNYEEFANTCDSRKKMMESSYMTQ
ncbi:hypothetical protein ACFLTH_09580 [Bacteroidota bacterium]